jgi:hypothetical protein
MHFKKLKMHFQKLKMHFQKLKIHFQNLGNAFFLNQKKWPIVLKFIFIKNYII